MQPAGQTHKHARFFPGSADKEFEENLFLTLLLKNETENMLRSFEDAGIPAIPLKGPLFAEKYFGHIGARWTSDIDLLIRTGDLVRAVDKVKTLGYTTEEKRIEGHFHWSFSKPLAGSPVPLVVELHWDLLKEGTSELNIGEFWDEAEPLRDFRFIRELSEYHTFYMICLHGWRHNLNGLKYFTDILQLLHVLGDHIHYAALFRDAEAHKTLNRIVRTLSIVYKQFPHLEKVKKLPLRRKRLWWEYEALRYADNRSIKSYMDWADYQLFSYDTFKHSAAGLREWLQDAAKSR